MGCGPLKIAGACCGFKPTPAPGGMPEPVEKSAHVEPRVEKEQSEGQATPPMMDVEALSALPERMALFSRTGAQRTMRIHR